MSAEAILRTGAGLNGDPSGDELLIAAANGDPKRLAELRRQVSAGEPAPYVAGFLWFRSRRFEIDSRAYITDRESTHLVDSVVQIGRQLEKELGRPPTVLEFGVGAGALAISVKLENPAWTVSGIDVDAAALEVAAKNVQMHRVAVRLLLSDYLSGWPATESPPDLIFGDPPWGGDTDLYADDRDAAYYRRMPARSAFPPGGSPCAIHDELIARLRQAGWPSLLVLNYGVLSRSLVLASTAKLQERRFVTPNAGLTIATGRAVRGDRWPE